MGLDSYFYATPRAKVGEIQTASSLNELGIERCDVEKLCSWRRHHSLHIWMERLFEEKGGLVRDEIFGFNQQYVRLLSEDLNKLEEDLRAGKIGDTEMLFNNEYTLDFCIPAAREAILAGKAVFYWSWI
jgi:hypothetical protein